MVEVLDPTLSRDNQPLVINDILDDKLSQSQEPLIEDTKSWVKARYTFGFLGFMGFALVYAMRVNLSIAIVSMVNQTHTDKKNITNSTDVCPYVDPVNGTFVPSAGEFNWDEKTQGVILGIFFVGYVSTNVPGGRLAEKYGGKLVYGLGVFLTAVLTIISPFAAYWGLIPFAVIRVAEGITEGVTFPAMHSMLAHWVPPLERSKFAATVYAGLNFGTVVSLPLSGWLCSLDLWGGWPLAFYLFGGLGVVWYVFWLIFVFDTPAQHTRIDPQERAFIEAAVKPKTEGRANPSVPWGAVFTSLPMWAITLTQCGQSWAFYILLTELPTFMDQILHFNIQQDAVFAMLPYLSAWIVGLGISVLADALLARNLLSTLNSFKFWNTIGSLGPSLSFLGAIWAGCDRDIILVMLVGLGSLQGAVYAGNQMNHIALAPEYAGTLYGLTNAAANTCGFLAPYVVGMIVQGRENLTQWHLVFWLAAGVNTSQEPLIEDTKSWVKARYTFGFLGFMGFALVYAMRVNLSIAIVSMVNQTHTDKKNITNSTDVCPYVDPVNGTFVPSAGEFNWDEKTQGVILGIFFVGYVSTNVPGGRLAEKYGGKLVYGLGVFLTAVLTIISPFAAYWGLIPFAVIRVAEGITEGVTFPAMHSMLAHWVPPLERSKFAATVYAGLNFGTVVSLPLSGWLCSLDLWGGWPLAFYLFGGLGVVWYVFWLIFVFDTPAQHTRIDPQERAFIEAAVKPKTEGRANPSVPWGAVFTSLPMWAITLTQCGQSWAFYILLTELPTFMDQILHFNIQQDAVFAMLPYLSAWIVGLGISVLADALLARNLLSTLNSFKFWNTIGSLGPSLSFLGAIWAGCDRDIILVMLVGLGSLQGAVYAGNQMNHIALAPEYAGTLYGLTNAAANTCGFLAPYVVGMIVQGRENLTQWHLVFWLAAGVNTVGSLFYVAFASSTEQPWSKGRR